MAKGICHGCGKEVHDEGGFHTVTRHHPSCPGGGEFCWKNCPVPDQCGPVEEYEAPETGDENELT